MKSLKPPYHFIISKMVSKNEFQALVILIIGIAITLAATFYAGNNIETRAKSEFALVCNEIRIKITTRLHAHAQLLRTASAFFAASDTVTSKEWNEFINHAKIDENLPGIQGVGFSMIIPRNQLPQHLQRIRNAGFPDYTIKPHGDREIYTSIIYLEPFTGRNLRAFGYDMFAEPVRRKAMEISRDASLAMLSGKVLLVQETNDDVQPGTLMYVPVYRNGMAVNTVEQRRSAIKGWVYSPYRMNDLIQGILGRWDKIQGERIHLQVYDDSISASSLLFDSQRNYSLDHSDSPSRTFRLPLEFNGKKWILYFSQPEEHLFYFDSKVIIVFIGGIVISFLLFGLFLSLINTKAKAIQIAGKLTAELMESEMLLLEMTNQVSGVVYQFYVRTDGEMGFYFVSDRSESVLGIKPYLDGYLDRFTALVIPELREDFIKSIEKSVNELSEWKYEGILQKPSGEKIWFSGNSNLTPRENELIFNGIVFDITDRKLTEQLLKDIIDKNPTSIQIVNTDGFTLSVNPAFAGIFGYVPPPGFSILDDLQNKGFEKLILLARSGEVVHFPDILYNAHDEIPEAPDVPIWIRAVLFSLKDSDGIPERFVFMHENITDRKLAEQEIQLKNEELQKLNATKDKFFSIIAHDLKSPFNSIVGFSNVLVDQIKVKDYEGIAKFAGIIRQSSWRALDLLTNLMDWAHSQTGRMEFNPEYFEMVDSIREISLFFDAIAGQKSIIISKALPPNAPVFADKAMISVVLRNLISNAIKFTKPGGEITITAIEKPGELTVAVSDNGVGIPKEMIGKLFRIDENYTTAGTSNEKGTGLGLILCKEFIEKHGGHIWVESEAGKGSTFRFTLPVNC